VEDVADKDAELVLLAQPIDLCDRLRLPLLVPAGLGLGLTVCYSAVGLGLTVRYSAVGLGLTVPGALQSPIGSGGSSNGPQREATVGIGSHQGLK